VLSNHEAVALAARTLDASGSVHDAAHALLFAACARWESGGRTVSDDVSVLLVLLDGGRVGVARTPSSPRCV
jgi:hypothetical protein